MRERFLGNVVIPGASPDQNIATPQDIEEIILFQKVKYVFLDRAGLLTPPWRKYGRKHRAEIGKIESILEKNELI
jgi:hypothetical protein